MYAANQRSLTARLAAIWPAPFMSAGGRATIVGIAALIALALIACRPAAASPGIQSSRPVRVDVILVDYLTLDDISRARDSLPMASNGIGGTVALLSPGLPRPPDPVANLYATVTAGDVVNTRNKQAGLLDRIAADPRYSGRLRVIRFGDFRAPGSMKRLLALLQNLTQSNRQAAGENATHQIPNTPYEQVIVCGVTPLRVGKWWNDLTPVYTQGDRYQTLISDTTHTTGLLALRDIAPTALMWAGIPVPDSMTGSSAYGANFRDRRGEAAGNPFPYLKRIESLANLNERILLWMGWIYGFVGGFAVVGALACAFGYLRRQRRAIRYMVRASYAMPLAMLIAPLPMWFGWVPMSLPAYGLLTVVIPLLIGAVLDIRRISLLTCVVLIGDAVTGTHLVAMSSLSGYWLSGIRFYGIGNEYMGVLVGMGLVATLALIGSGRPGTAAAQPGGEAPANGSQNKTSEAAGHGSSDADHGEPLSAGMLFALAIWFAAITVAVSFPAFGAKAGGAIVALAAFIPAWMGLVTRRPVRPAVFVWSTIAGFALIFIWSHLAAALGVRETHIQVAAAAVAHGKLGYVAHIAIRKAKLAIKTILTPGVIMMVLMAVAVVWLWQRTVLRDHVRTYLAGRPRMGAIMRAGIGALLPALLFNDAGIVAIVFIVTSIGADLLYEILG